MFVVCAVTQHPVKSMICTPLTVKDKEATFAVISTTADSQLRKGGMETPMPTPPPKRNCLNRKPLKRTLESGEKDAEG